MSLTYKDAGVDVEAGYRAVELMKKHVNKTLRHEVVGGLGSFGGAFELDLASNNIKNPVLISGTDGVGTKLKIAHIMDKHDTVGIDCVAMCVNDIACSGAEPLFFLDYIACGKNDPETIEKIVKGVCDGCTLSVCSLIGGETAEMPGFYKKEEYDIAGFSVGVVDKSKIVSSDDQRAGDVLIGISSSGVHSNGFSLIRKIFNIDDDPDILFKHFDDLGITLGEELLTPTSIYTKAMNKISNEGLSKGFMHITGGGFFENVPRGLKRGLGANIEKSTIDKMPIFELIKYEANLSFDELCSTFNAGIGMVCVSDESNVDEVIDIVSENGHKAQVIGHLIEGSGVSLS